MSYYAATEYVWRGSPTGQSLTATRFHAVPADGAGRPASPAALCGFRVSALGVHDGPWEDKKQTHQCATCRQLLRQSQPPAP